MKTVPNINTVKGIGNTDTLSRRECSRLGVRAGSVVNSRDPYFVVYSPSKGGGYDNAGVRGMGLTRREGAR